MNMQITIIHSIFSLYQLIFFDINITVSTWVETMP